jgi:hypothetical protein
MRCLIVMHGAWILSHQAHGAQIFLPLWHAMRMKVRHFHKLKPGKRAAGNAGM